LHDLSGSINQVDRVESSVTRHFYITIPEYCRKEDLSRCWLWLHLDIFYTEKAAECRIGDDIGVCFYIACEFCFLDCTANLLVCTHSKLKFSLWHSEVAQRKVERHPSGNGHVAFPMGP